MEAANKVATTADERLSRAAELVKRKKYGVRSSLFLIEMNYAGNYWENLSSISVLLPVFFCCSSCSIYWCRCMNHNSPLFNFPLCCHKLKFCPPPSSLRTGWLFRDGWKAAAGLELQVRHNNTEHLQRQHLSGGWGGGGAAIRLKSQSKMEARLSSVFNAGWTLRCDADTHHLRWLTAQCLWKAVQTNRCPPLPLQLIRTPHLAFFFFFHCIFITVQWMNSTAALWPTVCVRPHAWVCMCQRSCTCIVPICCAQTPFLLSNGVWREQLCVPSL